MDLRTHFDRDRRHSASLAGTSTSPLPRWQYAFTALLLAFSIGGTGRPPSVQSAQGGTNSQFFMRIIDPKTTLCTGETHTYDVAVYGQFDTTPGTKGPRKTNPQPMEGTKIEAYAEPTSLGTFFDRNKTGKAGSVYEETGASYLRPISAAFIFTAGKKPGKGNLTFQGIVDGYSVQEGYPPSVGYVSAPPLAIKVIPCKFKVKTIGFADATIYNITVISPDTVITADAAGNYTGSGTLSWVYSKASVPCNTFAISATDSQIDLTGELDDDGQLLTVTETFQPTTVSLNATCGMGSYSGQQPGSIDPVKLIVPSSGGVITQTASATGISFAVRISVTPEEDTAAAFNPDAVGARPGPPLTWLTALWDGFPRLTAAELGLYQ